METLKHHNPVRDALLAVLLLVLLKPALRLSANKGTTRSPALYCHLFFAHEPDPEVLDSIKTAKNQLKQSVIIARQRHKNNLIERLEELISQLNTVKKRYEKNSPALFFLGPIGSVSIVLKEIELESKIAAITNELNSELHKLANTTPTTKPLSIVTHLKDNQRLLDVALCA